MTRFLLQTLLAVLVLGGVSPLAFALEDTYTLRYQKTNQWVASADAKPLRDLMADAKKAQVTHFMVGIPEGNRELSLNRLIILRDILEKSLKTGVILEETRDADAPSNTLVILPKRA